MARPDNPSPTQLDRDLAELKLLEIAQHYREVLDEAARKGSAMLEVLATLIGMEQTVRQQRALDRRLRQARLPKQKTLADYDFNFPKRVPKTAIVRKSFTTWICSRIARVIGRPHGWMPNSRRGRRKSCGATEMLEIWPRKACGWFASMRSPTSKCWNA